MSCEKLIEKYADYILGRLDIEAVQEIDTHLARCPDCRQEVSQMTVIWEKLGSIPDREPEATLRSRFYSMLESEKGKIQQTAGSVSWREKLDQLISSWWPRRPVYQLATSVILLIVGLWLGSQSQTEKPGNGEITQLRHEIKEMQEMITISLLSQSSTSERLKGVSLSTEVDQPAESLLNELFDTLDNDPSTNVRIAVVDALTLFSDRAGVRERLIESLSSQDSPLVQIYMIDLLVQMREDKALKALKLLIEDQNIDRSVKQHAEESIRRMI
jgi:hypothetical protein